MTVSRGALNIFLTVAGIAILLGAVILIATILASNAPVKPIIYKTIELKKTEDPVKKAKLITELDEFVQQAENTDVADQWNRMMGCLATSCPDEAYTDMILVTVAAFEKEIPESALLINVIAAQKYWDNPEHILEFSKALSIANEQIEETQDKKIRKSWQQIVDCNNKCPEKNDLFFELIESITQ